MNKEQYTNWIKNTADIPLNMSISTEIHEHPYCMLFHLIRFMKTDTAENRASLAVLHPDRRRLRAILTPQQDMPQPESVKKDKKETIVKNALAESRSTDDLNEILQKRLAELKASSDKEEDELEEPIYEPKPSISLDELIEKFNKFPPKIAYNPNDLEDEENRKDLGKSSVFERTNIVSETLAELYVKQGATDKAVKMYEALKLKYPEKSVIFAEIIKRISDNKK